MLVIQRGRPHLFRTLIEIQGEIPCVQCSVLRTITDQV